MSQKEKKRLRDLETSAQTNARYKKLYKDQKAEIKAQKKLIDDLIKEKEEVLKKTTIECIEFEKKYNEALQAIEQIETSHAENMAKLTQEKNAAINSSQNLPQGNKMAACPVKNEPLPIAEIEIVNIAPDDKLKPQARPVAQEKKNLSPKEALPEIVVETIGLFSIPIEASNSIKNLASLISNISVRCPLSEDRVLNYDFVPFWKKLCLLGEDNTSPLFSKQIDRMEKYQEKAKSAKLLVSEGKYLQEVASCLEKGTHKDWVNSNITILRKIYSELKLSELSDDECITKVQHHLNSISEKKQEEAIRCLEREVKFRFNSRRITAEALFLWSKSDSDYLQKQYGDFNSSYKYIDETGEPEYGIPNLTRFDFLSDISKLLLRDPSYELTEANIKALDTMLEHALGVGYFAANQCEALKDFWLIIAQGLVRLGGDPLPWMNSYFNSNRINLRFVSNAIFKMAQVTHSILTTQIIRAKYSGESSVLIGQVLQQYFGEVSNFGTRLYDYSEIKTGWVSPYWHGFLNFICSQNESDLEEDRIRIYWSLISLTTDILTIEINAAKNIAETLRTKQATVKNLILSFIDKTNGHLSFNQNRGSHSAKKLKNILENIQIRVNEAGKLRQQKAAASTPTGEEDKNINKLRMRATAVVSLQLLSLENRNPKITIAQFMLELTTALLVGEENTNKNKIIIKEEINKTLDKEPKYYQFFAPARPMPERVVSDFFPEVHL